MTSTPFPLITIRNVTAFHLIGTSTLPLTPSPSPLTLLSTPPSSTLTLSLGSLAFALVPGTVFGTQEGNPAGFFLRPHVEPASGETMGGVQQPTGWIKLQLPAEGVDSGDSAKFEEILVEHGFLDGGVDVEKVKEVAAQVGEGIAQGGETVKQGIQQTAKKYQANHSLSPSDSPASFSPQTHSAFASAASGTATAASYVSFAADAVLGYAYKAGAAVGDAVGLHPGELVTSEEDKGETRKEVEGAFSVIGEAASSVGSGIAEGTSTVYHAATAAVQETVEKTQGAEAAELSSKAGETLLNVGDVGKGALLGTSVVVGGVQAGRGAGAGASEEAK